MVNALNGRHWVIDVANADTVHGANIKVKSIRWVDETAGAGDNVVVDNPVTGTILWETTAPGVNTAEAELLETWWPDGFGVPTLAGGTLHIELM